MKEAYCMKRTVVIRPKTNGKGIQAATGAYPKGEAQGILNMLKAAYNSIESCSDEVYAKYIPDSLLEDLSMNIRELSHNIEAQD